MDFVRHKYSCSSSSPETSTPAAAKHKKRPWRKITRGKWVSEVREPIKKSRIWLETFPRPPTADDAPLNFPASEASREFLEVACNRSPMAEGSEAVAGFLDEEAVFNMPALLDGMAEGMLLTPLGMKRGFRWSQMEVDDEEGLLELNLWED